MRSHFWKLLQEKAMRENRHIPISRVQAETGLPRRFLDKLVYDEFDTISTYRIEILCRYLNCGLMELLIPSDDVPDRIDNPQPAV